MWQVYSSFEVQSLHWRIYHLQRQVYMFFNELDLNMQDFAFQFDKFDLQSCVIVILGEFHVLNITIGIFLSA
jgi:hypothetical protein